MPTATRPKTSHKLDASLRVNLDRVRRDLGVGISYDIKIREFILASGRKAALIYLTNFIKDIDIQGMVTRLQDVEPDGMDQDAPIEQLIARAIGPAEVSTEDTYDTMIGQVLSGPSAVLLDGEPQALIFDLRVYPNRSIQEPQTERVTRGAHEGFVEAIITNSNLIRRHLRDPGLRFEMLRVGRRARTDVAIVYINDLAKPELVADLKHRIDKIDTAALSGGAKGLEEYLTAGSWNPLPRVRYTERPDLVAAHLLEGFVCILVDNAPVGMIVPATFFTLIQGPEDFFNNTLVGSYMRFVRLAAVFVSLILAPLWLAIVHDHTLLPSVLAWIGPRKSPGPIPLAAQLLLLEFGIDMIRIALIHTPAPISTSLGIVGAILLGQLAVQVGFFAPETILYAAIVAIGFFATPSIELGMALRLFRYVLYAGSIIWGFKGFLIALFAVLAFMTGTRSFGVPFLWPMVPWNSRAMLRLAVRLPVPMVSTRPRLVVGRDRETKGRLDDIGGHDDPLSPN
ncbi:MAG TPA: spore germination protein [Limnochordia bacterium]|nr:spore germination protein [Limnochordia bacterium]